VQQIESIAAAFGRRNTLHKSNIYLGLAESHIINYKSISYGIIFVV